MRIEITGHTCDLGPKGYNRRLSEERAESVARYLKGHFSIDPEAIRIVGMGEESPLLPNKDNYARTLNRRVEVKIIRYSG
ncbi:MAG: OmpA family protein [bacterium]|nr:OmpA family protein [bacterium]